MQLLSEIKDADYPSDESILEIREASRAIAFDEDNLIPILFVGKRNCYKLPGGGIDDGENQLEALAREMKEEAGCTIEVTGEVGEVIEFRSKWNLKQTSYCYLGKVVLKGDPEFTETELKNGFKLIWVSLDEAITKIENDKPADYEGKFIQQRDLILLKKAKEIVTAQ
jgi:8-oxo-dGTP pyrophosphatase MutT (NUDIX family)